jgi:succinyl-diaminopimelate desuccinylase
VDVLDRIRRAAEGRREEMIDLQRALTAVPALGPENGGTGEWEKARVLVSRLAGLGLPAPESHPAPDPRVPEGTRPNLVVSIPGLQSDRSLWIMSHLDIVPPGDPSLWSSDPYTLVVSGDRIIGRGVEDNQQGLVSSLFAAVILAEEGLTPACGVKLLFVSDEETGSDRGIRYLLDATGMFRPSDSALVPDGGSADGAEVEIAEKSLLWLRLRTRGRQCHASVPHKGINAFAAGSHLVVRLGELSRSFPERDSLFDPPISTFTPTKKEANVPNVNTIPGEDVFYLDSRIIPVVDVDRVLSRIREIADGVEKDFGVTVDFQTVQRASSPPTPRDAPIVGALGRAIRSVYGVEARSVGIGGGTVGAFLRARGIPTVVWSRVEETAHMPNESCLVSNMIGDCAVMAALMVSGAA